MSDRVTSVRIFIEAADIPTYTEACPCAEVTRSVNRNGKEQVFVDFNKKRVRAFFSVTWWEIISITFSIASILYLIYSYKTSTEMLSWWWVAGNVLFVLVEFLVYSLCLQKDAGGGLESFPLEKKIE